MPCAARRTSLREQLANWLALLALLALGIAAPVSDPPRIAQHGAPRAGLAVASAAASSAPGSSPRSL